MHHHGFKYCQCRITSPVAISIEWSALTHPQLSIGFSFSIPHLFLDVPYSIFVDFTDAMKKQGLNINPCTLDNIPF